MQIKSQSQEISFTNKDRAKLDLANSFIGGCVFSTETSLPLKGVVKEMRYKKRASIIIEIELHVLWDSFDRPVWTALKGVKS
jgi:hypothetical protein